jgi:hypothetical protein
MVLFVISTSIAPYEQWLTGRVVELCDVALGTHFHPASSGSQQQHHSWEWWWWWWMLMEWQ